MTRPNPRAVAAVATLALLVLGLAPAPAPADDADLWQVAQQHRDVHRYSTLFTAHDVHGRLATDVGIDRAIAWCRATGVTRAYVESYRSRLTVPRAELEHARDRLRDAGIEVSGCVTPTQVGKRSTGWDEISCYTDPATQARVREIFEYAARSFDEVMIDDFWFTDCECADCDAARKARTVTVNGKTTPVAGDSWSDYRRALMLRISEENVLAAARRANPNVRLIIKYPQWYDRFHERGYDVAAETAAFDRTWVGTETRDYDDKQWGGFPQYGASWLMRWLGDIGGDKCGGGWFDPYGTSPATYVEQARATVLGGARESVLFCYGALQERTGPPNVAELRKHIPELLAVAGEVAKRHPAGLASYKPANSPPLDDDRVFDFAGMVGLPLNPCHEFPADAKAALFSCHALADPDLAAKLDAFLDAGKPAIVTDALARRLAGAVDLDRPNVQVLTLGGAPKSLLGRPQSELDALRAPALKALGHEFQAPEKVALHLFDDGSTVIENFRDEPAEVVLDGDALTVAPRGWLLRWK